MNATHRARQAAGRDAARRARKGEEGEPRFRAFLAVSLDGYIAAGEGGLPSSATR